MTKSVTMIEPKLNLVGGCICKYEDCMTPEYVEWSKRMGAEPVPSRKQWENVQIAQALFNAGCLASGKRGLGFGVGKERLVSLFASLGANILATDQELSEAARRDWQETGQLSVCADELYFPDVIGRKDFDKRVSFETCDMNAIPASYEGAFDFTYSACSMDHLGSLEKSTQFFVNSLKCLKPGGVSVHTTEYNLYAEHPDFAGKTTEAGSTVFFRKSDIELLVRRVRDAGYIMQDVDYSRGEHPENYNVDYEPHPRAKSHLVLQVCTGDESGGKGWIVTSIVLIACRPAKDAI